MTSFYNNGAIWHDCMCLPGKRAKASTHSFINYKVFNDSTFFKKHSGLGFIALEVIFTQTTFETVCDSDMPGVFALVSVATIMFIHLHSVYNILSEEISFNILYFEK